MKKKYQAHITILKNRDIYKHYLEAKNQKTFREKHLTEIMLYETSRKELQELTGEKTFPSINDIRRKRSELYRKKHAQYEEYSRARAHDIELSNIETNIQSILNLGKEKVSNNMRL